MIAFQSLKKYFQVLYLVNPCEILFFFVKKKGKKEGINNEDYEEDNGDNDNEEDSHIQANTITINRNRIV